MHPVLDLGRDGDPDAVFGVAKDEVDFADGLAVDAVGQYSGLATARHDLQAIGAEVGDEDVAVPGEREAVGKSAGQVSRGFTVGFREMAGDLLRDDLLRAIVAHPHYAAARVGRPERSILFGENAFGPLQAIADVA